MPPKEDLKIRFKFNEAMTEEECDAVFFKIYDLILGSVEPEDAQIKQLKT